MKFISVVLLLLVLYMASRHSQPTYKTSCLGLPATQSSYGGCNANDR
ncbi:MAG TPA: hypothetical protein VHA33_29310 [Candidatus Angelobacter sp.]|nr:hypothetical protein [Candidatus Angelobacter sp.]